MEMLLNVKFNNRGLISEDVEEIELKSDYSWITFGRSVFTPLIFIIYMVGTTDKEQGKGYATKLLDYFFDMVKKDGGVLKIESYTAAGEIKIRHVIERLAKKYKVRLI